MLIRFKYAPQPESEKDFDRIARSVSRMSHQLENVMDFVTSKGLEIDDKSLNEIIKNAIDRAIIPDSIKINLPSEDIMIKCDSEKLEIALDNILVNAKQAIDNSGTIDIRSSQEANSTKIEIHDSGPGIPDDILPKIFEPLFTTKQEGTGLGLSSCKSIIEQHGGNISVKTEKGKGTTFVITLPIVKSQKSIIITE
jgi:two-component system sensor histidine kinase HydH